MLQHNVPRRYRTRVMGETNLQENENDPSPPPVYAVWTRSHCVNRQIRPTLPAVWWIYCHTQAPTPSHPMHWLPPWSTTVARWKISLCSTVSTLLTRTSKCIHSRHWCLVNMLLAQVAAAVATALIRPLPTPRCCLRSHCVWRSCGPLSARRAAKDPLPLRYAKR